MERYSGGHIDSEMLLEGGWKNKTSREIRIVLQKRHGCKSMYTICLSKSTDLRTLP